MKKLAYILGGLILGGAVFIGMSASAQVSSNYWKLTAGTIQPGISTWTLSIPYLTNQNCIGTDGNGLLQAGSCGGGGGVNGVATSSLQASWPIAVTKSVASIVYSFLGISTSTTPTTGNLSYWTGANKLGKVATSSISVGTSLSVTGGSLGSQVGGVAATINTIQGIRTADSPSFTGLTISGITGTQCLHAISGVVSGTGSDCGSGGGNSFGYPFPANATSTLLTFNAGVNTNATTGAYFINNVLALQASTTRHSIAVGNALNSSYTGGFNVGVGDLALTALTSGTQNFALGYEALFNNTAGSYNLALGALTGFSNTYGSNNVMVGASALYYGQAATSTIAIGYFAGLGTALYHNKGGVYIGDTAGNSLQNNSDYNTLLGYQSGNKITTGSNNLILATATSSLSVANLTTGKQNILIGNNISLPSATKSGQLDIGNIIYGVNNTGTSSNLSGGTIGIGTTTPWARLSVVGNTTPVFAVASSTVSGSSGPLLEVDKNGHVISYGAAPALSSCGTTPTVVGNDADMLVTVGSVSATGCTVTFHNAYAATPTCTVTNQTVSVVNAMTYTVSTSAVTVSQTGLTGDKLNIMCHEPHS